MPAEDSGNKSTEVSLSQITPDKCQLPFISLPGNPNHTMSGEYQKMKLVDRVRIL
jgi:hypothetical protein